MNQTDRIVSYNQRNTLLHIGMVIIRVAKYIKKNIRTTRNLKLCGGASYRHHSWDREHYNISSSPVNQKNNISLFYHKKLHEERWRRGERESLQLTWNGWCRDMLTENEMRTHQPTIWFNLTYLSNRWPNFITILKKQRMYIYCSFWRQLIEILPQIWTRWRAWSCAIWQTEIEQRQCIARSEQSPEFSSTSSTVWGSFCYASGPLSSRISWCPSSSRPWSRPSASLVCQSWISLKITFKNSIKIANLICFTLLSAGLSCLFSMNKLSLVNSHSWVVKNSKAPIDLIILFWIRTNLKEGNMS